LTPDECCKLFATITDLLCSKRQNPLGDMLAVLNERKRGLDPDMAFRLRSAIASRARELGLPGLPAVRAEDTNTGQAQGILAQEVGADAHSCMAG
jgi:hypothetical protein